MYIIHSGKVKLFVENEKNYQCVHDEFKYNLEIEEIKTNENFGDSEVFARCRRITSAITLEDCQLYKLSQFDLDSVMIDYPRIKMHKVTQAVKYNQ